MKKVIFWSSIVTLFFCMLETAILSHINLLSFRPEFILILVVYISIYNGSTIGTTCGFISGLILDLMSLSPIGLHSFLFSLIGYLIGIFHRQYNLNKVIMPSILTLISIFITTLLLFALSIFGENILIHNIFNWQFWIQVGITIIFAPIEFAIFNMFENILKAKDF